MTFETPLYQGWWVYAGLIGLGLLLIAISWPGVGLWLSLVFLLGAALAAFLAIRRGWSPRRQITTILSEDGVTVLGHPSPPEGQDADFFLAWTQITGVRMLPRPGYWHTSILTIWRPQTWIYLGQGLELAEAIAEVAGLPYAEGSKQPVRMGVEHYWFNPAAPERP